jgi:hypothetical protein
LQADFSPLSASVPVDSESNLDDPLALVHRTAARTFREIVFGKIFKNMITDPTNHKVLSALVLPSFPKYLRREPRKKESAQDPNQIDRDHSV